MLKFGQALERLKIGVWVQRAAWAEKTHLRMRDGRISVYHAGLKADWQPWQSDILAEDWREYQWPN